MAISARSTVPHLPYSRERTFVCGQSFCCNFHRCSKFSFLVRIELGANMTIAVAEL